MDPKLFETDPRSYALGMVKDGPVPAEYMLRALLCYMSHDDVRDALDANELSPRFTEDEDEDEANDTEDEDETE